MNENNKTLDTPIALAIFKRSDKTCRIIQTLKKVRPQQIFIFGDGPRKNNLEECQQVKETRRRVLQEIDWPCQVKTNFLEENMGGPIRIPSGLDWVFSHVDRAIFIEDDVIFSTDFLYFAEELLTLYEDDHRIGTVTARNPVKHKPVDNSSYFFHILPNTGGCCGMWKRTWDIFSRDMSHWPQHKKDNLLYRRFTLSNYAKKQEELYESLYNKEKNNPNYFFLYCFISHGYLSIIPSQNQARKDGADLQAQHLQLNIDPRIEKLERPIRHPQKIISSVSFEKKRFNQKYKKNGLLNKALRIYIRIRINIQNILYYNENK